VATIPESIKSRTRFHPICIGDKAGAPADRADKFRTLVEVMAELHHTDITLLKVRIGGSKRKTNKESKSSRHHSDLAIFLARYGNHLAFIPLAWPFAYLQILTSS